MRYQDQAMAAAASALNAARSFAERKRISVSSERVANRLPVSRDRSERRRGHDV